MHTILSLTAILAFLYLARPGGPLRPENDAEPVPVRTNGQPRPHARNRRG